MFKIFVKDFTSTVSPEIIGVAVESFLQVNPVVADEPLLAAHLVDTTPHPAYDELVRNRFTTYLRNGMA